MTKPKVQPKPRVSVEDADLDMLRGMSGMGSAGMRKAAEDEKRKKQKILDDLLPNK